MQIIKNVTIEIINKFRLEQMLMKKLKAFHLFKKSVNKNKNLIKIIKATQHYATTFQLFP